jgi:hypothetical protein
MPVSSIDLAAQAECAGLWCVNDAAPGITRQRWGTGWRYWRPDGTPITELAVLAAQDRTHPRPTGLIALTCNEIARLLNRLVIDPARQLVNPLSWTNWRRRHQYRARESHYRTRPAT